MTTVTAPPPFSSDTTPTRPGDSPPTPPSPTMTHTPDAFAAATAGAAGSADAPAASHPVSRALTGQPLPTQLEPWHTPQQPSALGRLARAVNAASAPQNLIPGEVTGSQDKKIPLGQKQDAASMASSNTAAPYAPFAAKVARSFIQAKLGIDGDQYVVAHFKDDESKRQGQPDWTRTLTEDVMNGFSDFAPHGAVMATVGFVGGIASGGDSPSTFQWIDGVAHSHSLGDALLKTGKFLLSRTGPGYLYNTFFAPGNMPDTVDESLRTMDKAFGVYKNNDQGYTRENSYELSPSQVYGKLHESDPDELPYIKELNRQLDTYWKEHKSNWPILARRQFVEQARQARDDGVLTRTQYEMVMKGGVPNAPLDGPVSLEQLSASSPPDPSVEVRRFDINGYAADTIRRFIGPDQGEVMYIAGQDPHFVTSRHVAERQQWVKDQGGDSETRSKLLADFSIYNRQDGTTYSGVESALKGLAGGAWNGYENRINYYGERVTGDVFDDMRDKVESRLRSDASMETRTLWEERRDVLDRLGVVLAPVVQLGTGIDKAVNGKTSEERKAGLMQSGDAALAMAVMAATGGKGAGKPATESVSEAGGKPAWSSHLIRRNGYTAYPMSPIRPPRLPETAELPQPNVSSAASSSGPTESDLIQKFISASDLEEKKARYKELTDHFFESNPSFPPRPAIPSLPANAAVPDLISKVYENSNGLVLGEDHTEIASLKFLVDHIEELKRNGVSTLYVEGLGKEILDTSFAKGPKVSAGLTQDEGRGGFGWPYRAADLYAKAKNNGIRVVGIDDTGFTKGKRPGFLEYLFNPGSIDRYGEFRLKAMNYWAMKVIKKDQIAQPGKWLAFVGQSHMNGADNGVPGLTNLLGGIGVEIHNAPKGMPTSVSRPEPGYSPLGSENGDFRIDMNVDNVPRAADLP